MTAGRGSQTPPFQRLMSPRSRRHSRWIEHMRTTGGFFLIDVTVASDVLFSLCYNEFGNTTLAIFFWLMPGLVVGVWSGPRMPTGDSRRGVRATLGIDQLYQ